MHKNPELEPVVITDVNGKITTVHRKKPAASGKTSGVPAPVTSKAKLSPEVMIQEIVDIVSSITPAENFPRLRIDATRLDELEGLRTKNPARLFKVHEFFTYVSTGNGAYRAIYNLLYSSIGLGERRMETLHAYREYVLENPEWVVHIMRVHAVLTQTYKFLPDKEGRVPTLAEHMRARMHYEEKLTQELWELGSDLISYESNSVYIKAVQKYAANLDVLMAYREQRGIHLLDDEDAFDDLAFDEYLKQHPSIAEGWL